MFDKKPEYVNETAQVKEYFASKGIELTEEFDIKICAESISQSVYNTSVMLCNLEDENIMSQVAKGDYDEFDVDNESLFNDEYQTMCEFLNL